MRVLVTGGSGFIGRALCARLVRAGWLVRSASRAVHAPQSEPEIEWVRVESVNAHTDWSAALAGVSHVVHLAAVAHVMSSRVADINELWEVNVSGSVRLAECAARAGVERFVFLSSIGAVCSASARPVSEAVPPAPETPYGRSKRAAETGIIRALEGSRTSWSILRPSLVHGPGNPGNLARLMRAIRRGFPLPFAGFDNRRSLVFVDNLVDAIVLALTRPEAASEIFHVADAEVVSTPQLIRAIAAAAGRKARLFSLPRGVLRTLASALDLLNSLRGDRRRRAAYSLDRLGSSLVVDSTVIRRELGWTQSVSMETGLRRTFGRA